MRHPCAVSDARVGGAAWGSRLLQCLRAEIEEAFPSWRADHVEPASTEGMPKPIQATTPSFYRLVRS